ncbi:MAG: PadR family transcriptional regulator [Solirubrobacterales bacterium]
MYSKHSHRHPRHPGGGLDEFARSRGFGGPGFGPGGRGRGRGPRARRGDIRAAVLALLADRPMHGYEMIKETEERSEGAWTPSAGSIYPTLQMLEDEGLIRGEDSDGKRRFSLTDEGRKAYEEKSGDVAPWDAVRAGFPTGHLALRHTIGQLILAVKAAADGTEDQQKQVRELLDETRRKIYRILAEGPADQQD